MNKPVSFVPVVRLVLLTALVQASASAQFVSFVESRATSLRFPDGGSVIGMAKADFNGDGKLDLAVTQVTTVPNVGDRSFVSILLGEGDGTFRQPISLPIPYDPQLGGTATGIAANDFDGDGKVDIVVTVPEQSKVIFFKSRGDGSSADAVSTDVGFKAGELQAADLDGDGTLDLVVSSYAEKKLAVLHGNGDGTFTVTNTVTLSGSPNNIAINDLNRDFKPDIVAGCYDSKTIEVLLNNGNGGFPASPSVYPTEMGALGLYVADFDNDGNNDVVVSGLEYDNGFIVIKGNGDGTLQLPPSGQSPQVPRHRTENRPQLSHTENIAPDLNGDGLPDLIFGHPGNWLTVALNDGKGSFQLQELVAAPGPGFNKDSHGRLVAKDGSGSDCALAGDFNGDGITDIVVGQYQANGRMGGLSFIAGNGGGQFEAARSFAVSGGNTYGPNDERTVALRDFTGDNILDLAVLARGKTLRGTEQLVDVLPGIGDGTFGAPILSVGSYYPATTLSAMRVADLNGDGVLDLVLAASPAAVSGNSGTPTVGIAYGNGNGTFAKSTEISLGDPSWIPINIAVADFNRDGVPDIAVWVQRYTQPGDSGWHFEIYLQDPSTRGSYTRSYGFPQNDLGANDGGEAFAVYDMDGDGNVDIIVQGSGPDHTATQTIQIFKGNGDGTFQAPITVGPFQTAGPIVIRTYRAADFNGDGELDLIVGGNNLSIYYSTGSNTFAPPVSYDTGVGGGATELELTDFDGDGNTDIAFNVQTGGFSVLLGRPDGTFRQSRIFAIGSGSSNAVAIGDLNGDGLPDAVVTHEITSPASNAVTALINDTSPPQILGLLSITATVGRQFTYQIVATNSPTGYSASGLPDGLVVDSRTGLISGVPQSPGTISGQVSASNAIGGTSANFTINIQPTPSAGPLLTGGTSATGRTGQPFRFQLLARRISGNARASAVGLPAGLTLDPASGLITGTPTEEGTFNVTITITDGKLAASETLQLTFVSDPSIPVITSSDIVTLARNKFFEYTIVAPADADPSDPIIYTLVGTLPPGLGFDPQDGVISGTFTARAFRTGGGNPLDPLNDTPVVDSVQIVATNSNGTASKTLIFVQPAADPILNISTRLPVRGGDNVLIGGFIITGQDAKKLIIRGIGPSLTAAGIEGALANPTLELHASSNGSLVAANDNWKDTQRSDVEATTIPPVSDLESAIVQTLAPGAYTAILGSKDGSAGIGLVEIYDLSQASASKLANISTRGSIDTGNNVMIGGFIVGSGGSGPAKVIVRGLGPSLNNAVTGALQDPVLELRNSNGGLVAANDNWKETQQADIEATTIPPIDDHESAIVSDLVPGGYTAILRGKGDTTGIGLVELYSLQ